MGGIFYQVLRSSRSLNEIVRYCPYFGGYFLSIKNNFQQSQESWLRNQRRSPNTQSPFRYPLHNFGKNDYNSSPSNLIVLLKRNPRVHNCPILKCCTNDAVKLV